ncbi:toll-like receptor 1 [Mercenaria mercenaria]|uniref:toll-like receptor 1 n=1 Tax=Mercenaria mercenaria TaxID=6596 RepID=UPI00234EFE8B|nr:toll-like receptor 1 [Mercenaria mercenaria]
MLFFHAGTLKKTIKMRKSNFVALSYCLIQLVVTYELPGDCNFFNTVLTCQRLIPSEIPAGTQTVYIKDYDNNNIGQGRFAHSSWGSVKQFDINANIEIYLQINSFVFLGLENMTTLGIHARKGNIIYEKAFVGVDLVEKLDLSNMIYLESETLIKPLLYGNVFPNLRVLILENVNTEQNNFNFNFSRSFVEMVRSKNITELSLRGTNLLIERNLNAISTGVHILDVSNVSVSVTKGFKFGITFPHLKIINFSNSVSRYFSSKRFANRVKTAYCNFESLPLATLEKFYANFFYRGKEVYVNNVTIDISAPCFQVMKIEVLHLRGNMLPVLNATVHLPVNFSLYELDLSLNSMTFLSASVLKDMVNLNNLYLGEHLLFKMTSHPDFKILFKPLQRLKRLSLAYNQITYIPEQMFLHNLDLEWLDLQGNFLMTTSFLHSQMSKLIFLNISHNRIAYLTGDDLMKLKKIATGNGSKLPEVMMNDNPFECSCESVGFIETIRTNILNNTGQYICNFETEMTPINDNSIAKAKFLCIRAIFYTISSVISVLVVLSLFITFLLTLRYFRKKRRLTKLQTLLQKFNKGLLRENFLCSLSYSDSDAEVSNQLYIRLEALLKDITKCERDAICIDFKHYRAGKSIVEEIIRCISGSLVAVFVVSEAFCRSDWCCLEVKEAYEQQKPIILIFVEEVSEESMTIYIRNIFNRYTRGKLVETENGEVDYMPGGLKGLCNSIILLGSESSSQRVTQV